MSAKNRIPKPKTKFLRLKCPGCGNEQTTFSAASTIVRCLKCETVLTMPLASNSAVRAKVLKEFE